MTPSSATTTGGTSTATKHPAEADRAVRASPGDPTPALSPNWVTYQELMRMTRPQLDALYGANRGREINIPDGDTRGTGVILPGRALQRVLGWFVRGFCWQGKVFDRAAGGLVNKVSPLSLKSIKAKVYTGESWLDGGDSIIIDYSQTSTIAKKVRDEIRQVGPGLYLGKVYWGDRTKRLVDFVLQAPAPVRQVRSQSVLRLCILALGIAAIWAYVRFTSNSPVTYADAENQFKYGSTGGEIESGIPYAIWKALPGLFRDYLPPPGYVNGREYESFGFIYETGRDLPVGVSMRNVQGIDRVFLNCAVCHSGTVRDSPAGPRRVYLGMPANTVDLQAFSRFLFRAADDPRLTRDLMGQIDAEGGHRLDCLNRLIVGKYAVYVLKDRLLMLLRMFSFMDHEPCFGPGRFDTFNPPKALLHFPMDRLSEQERIGICDFPSVWNQGQRKGMNLHWDGNNSKVEERNRSAAFGTGALPPTLDRKSVRRIENWLLTAKPPPFPYPVETGRAERGKVLYAEYCARCHGRDGQNFEGELVGQVTPIDRIGTSRRRLDSYTEELCAAQNTLYAGYDDERFSHFRKTNGYANAPLDGIWLRAPYLHNGSVPTLRDLLEPAARRPQTFYRGYDVYDPVKLGFVADVPSEGARQFFKIDTRIEGNGNSGHEGREYGTELPDAEKDAIVEYLKTF